ncbi:hypothetical protein FRC07_006926 [Ceratobasidium sp. 392]|nr:hypothetical protein FRC07_006926 [Ceratobasidium sp. 392]
MELPANMLTPTKFCDRIAEEFKGVENVKSIVRDKTWAEGKGMRTFLSVTNGTDEPPKFLEMLGAESLQRSRRLSRSTPRVRRVGKRITFDSGGISIKPADNMKLMRDNTGGAAAVICATFAIAKLGTPINLVTLTTFIEDLLGPSATKPGDVVYAMNCKTVEIDNTDAEGRIIPADALWYGSTEFNAHTIVDCAILTGAMVIALGEVFSVVFSASDSLWEELRAAGEEEHDPFWRMPLDERYAFQINSSNADLCNIGGRPAGSCTAALFLKSFVNGT